MTPVKTTVFKREGCSPVYRIPSLIYLTEDKSYIAFAEKRSSESDEDAKILVMRKREQHNGSNQWSDVKELNSAILPDYRPMCPCPVYERNTKTLFLFFICVKAHISESTQIKNRKNEARLCYVSSKDNGQSWSEVKDLTESVIADEVRKWATFGVGPGHGIQMENGRLVIPAYTQYIHEESNTVEAHSFHFYSDDNGEKWEIGTMLHTASNECQMAEIIYQDEESLLYCNARNPRGKSRVEGLRKRNENGFDTQPSKLVETGRGCQGSVVGFPAPEVHKKNGKTWLLYSHPIDKRRRRDLGLYLNRSPLHTQRWEKPWIIHHGPSGYSDLAHGEGENFACLMECGDEKMLPSIMGCKWSKELEEIAFVEFHLNDVIYI